MDTSPPKNLKNLKKYNFLQQQGKLRAIGLVLVWHQLRVFQLIAWETAPGSCYLPSSLHVAHKA